jgi:hypothetical protein
VAADAGTVVQMNSASATTITVNTALFAAGDTVQIQNVGAGVCTVTAGTATVSTSATLALKQYDAGSLYFNTTSAAIFFAVDAADGMANPLTTTGDIIYSSSGTTAARLGIGSSGQSLVVASGIPSWATPASGALTFIRRSSFSSVATTTTTFDGIFTSTYKVYIVIIESMFSSTDQGILQLQYRAGATTKSGANYYGQAFGYDRTNTLSTRGQIGTTLFSICELATGTNPALANITFDFVGNSSQNPTLNGTFHSIRQANTVGVVGSYYADPDTMTGLIFSASAGNITGTVSVYGLATA